MFHRRITKSASREDARVRFARHGAAISILTLGLSHAAAATTYFTLASVPGSTPSATINFIDQNSVYNNAGGYYDDIVLKSSTPSTMAASSPGGASLGSFSLNFNVANIGTAYLAYPAADTVPATPTGVGGIYYEHYHASAILNAILYSSVSGSLLNATLSGISIYAMPSSSTATIELDLTKATSAVVSVLPSTLYLDFTGMTSNPITLSTITLSPAVSFMTFGSMSLDLSGTVSDTPYSPTAVPLPASAWLLLSGLGGVGFLCRRRSVKLSAA